MREKAHIERFKIRYCDIYKTIKFTQTIAKSIIFTNSLSNKMLVRGGNRKNRPHDLLLPGMTSRIFYTAE